MADIHIDDFYRDSARVLIRLYAVFPRAITLYVEDISGPDEPDEFGLHHPRFEACFSTMVWLAQSDYLRFDQLIRKEALDQAVLTKKAFLALAAPSTGASSHNKSRPGIPPSISERTNTHIAQLRNALTEGSSIQLKAAVIAILCHPDVNDFATA